MKKKIDIAAVANSLRGESVFFPTKDGKPAPEHAGEPRETGEEKVTLPALPPQVSPSPDPTVSAQKQDARILASSLASKHTSTLAEDESIHLIANTLKSLGKEVIYVRSTVEEKAEIRDIVYTYGRQGIKTSDNELGRIAINCLLKDYKAHGEESVLAKVLKELHP